MEVLEINPPKIKLWVVIVEKEYDGIIQELESNPREGEVPELHRPSIAFREALRRLVLDMKPDLITHELGDDLLAETLKELNTPLFTADISEYAKEYLVYEVDKVRETLNSVLTKLREMDSASKSEREYLAEYARYLKEELESKIEEIKREIRPAWIVKGIIDSAEKIAEERKKSELLGVHVCSPEHLHELSRLLDSFGVRHEVLSVKKEYLIEDVKAKGIPGSINIKVKLAPKETGKMPYILFFLTTDEIASPFDVSMAYDAGFDTVKTYENMDPDKARTVIQDAMFSRGSRGIRRTVFFISGRKLDKVEEIAEIVKKTMFEPFKTSIIVDPRGAYTTAAAMVAKAEEGLKRINLGRISDKKCVVFGTGPVGIVTSVLLSKMGCETAIVEPYEGLNQAYVNSVVESIRKNYGARVHGVFAPTKIERESILQTADVVFVATAPGVRVIDRSMIERIKRAMVFVDVNAVPPSGVEGVDLKDDMKRIHRGIYGIGALKVGELKYRIEMEMLKEARLSGGGVYEYNYALEKARELLERKMKMEPAFTVALSSVNIP